ncbi:hypothetical protein EJ08DRAFT_721726 [Tothia fuscella]|uniref:Uncharacterized protein n=1 Tax=Tothia fuscella TaxID=1048955 RepID=A0A9P4NL31_9PEZI|nr:hypothetical protein EJ08DRAFT_721726 [Tothia fuscella]
MSVLNGPPLHQFDSPPQLPGAYSTRTNSSESESTSRHQSQSPNGQSQRKPEKASHFRNFFSAREPSAAAFAQMAKQQRTETAARGLSYQSGVTMGKLTSKVEEDRRSQEAAAKKKAKMYEKLKKEGRPSSSYSQSSIPPEPIKYQTLDPAAGEPGIMYSPTSLPVRSGLTTTPLSRTGYIPDSPRQMRLPSLDAVLENGRQYHRSTSSNSDLTLPSTRSSESFVSSSMQVMQSDLAAVPWEVEETEKRTGPRGFMGFGKR